MAALQLAVHIPPEATPENITAMLRKMIETQAELPSVEALKEFLVEHEIGSRTEIQSMAERMGLLDKRKDAITVSDRGYHLMQYKDNLLPDIYHFLIYTGWEEAEPLTFLPAWAYRYLCDHWWNADDGSSLTDSAIDILVSDLIEHAEAKFAEYEIEEINGVSFSPKSVRGARRWLDALTPPVIEKNVFTRRPFCPPELLLLALGWAFRHEPDPIGVPLLLSRTVRETVCRVCLLDPKYLDRVLDWALPRFPHLIASEEKAGFYGRSIRLHKLPTVEDFAS